MKKILRNLIENDIDKILDNEEIKSKNFFFLIVYYLLDNNRVNLKEVHEVAIELSNKYETFLRDFDLELLESNGEIIKVLKSAIPKFNKRMVDILEKIENIKKNDNSNHNFN